MTTATSECTDWTRANLAYAGSMEPLTKIDITASGYYLARAANGDPILCRRGSSIDHPEDPRITAANLAASWAIPPNTDGIIVVSPGLYYEVEFLLERIHPHQWIAFVEPDAACTALALSARDLSKILRRPKARWFFGDDPVAYGKWTYQFLRDQGVVNVFVIGATAAALAELEQTSAFMRETQSASAALHSEISTLRLYGEALDRNAVRLLPYLARTRDLGELYVRLAGRPVVLLAAGPSAGGAIPALADRSLPVLAADTITRHATRSGVRVTCSIMLDLSAKTLGFYDGVDTSVFPLFFDSDSYWETVARHRGPLYSGRTASAWSQWFHSHVRPLAPLEKGTSVLLTAFDLAARAGASSIILAGADLSFPGDRTHSDGAALGWGDGSVVSLGNLMEVPSVTGGRVQTCAAFATFASRLEHAIADYGRPVYQTSPAGARIRGAIEVSLEEGIRCSSS